MNAGKGEENDSLEPGPILVEGSKHKIWGNKIKTRSSTRSSSSFQEADSADDIENSECTRSEGDTCESREQSDPHATVCDMSTGMEKTCEVEFINFLCEKGLNNEAISWLAQQGFVNHTLLKFMTETVVSDLMEQANPGLPFAQVLALKHLGISNNTKPRPASPPLWAIYLQLIFANFSKLGI